MDVKEVVAEAKNRLGYHESEHKDEVLKGVQLAHGIMVGELAGMKMRIAQAEVESERLRTQLRTVSAIFAEHAEGV